MLATRRLLHLAPPRHAHALLGLVAITVLALVTLALAVSPAGAESIDIYEFEELDATHGAEAVAMRADGNEGVVLTSDRNVTTGLYTNYVYSTAGSSLMERAKYINETWRWTCAAFDPADTVALLGGTQGRLYKYDGGTVSSITTSIGYEFTAIDWHPTSHEAYLGVTTSRMYKYRSGSLMHEVYTSNRITDLDVRPDGGEIVISSYYYIDIYNLTRSSMERLSRPVGDDREYYYCYGVEYNNDGSYFLASWYDFNSYTMFRYVNDKWVSIANTAGQVSTIRFENEGTFALLGMSNNLQHVVGASVAPVQDWYSVGASAVTDIDYSTKDFYFLMGTDSKVLKFKRKDNVKPWLDRPIPDVTIDEDAPGAGDNLIDLLNYVMDDRDFSKLRFELDYQEDPGLIRGSVDDHYLDFEQMIEHWNGKVSFRLKIWDRGFDDIEGSFDDVFNRSNTFTVEVRPINDPVTLVSLGDRIIGEDDLVFFVSEGQERNLTIVTHDVDNIPSGEQPPQFSFNRSLPSIRVDAEEMVLSFVPRNKDVGTIYISLLITDGFGSTVTSGIIFHIKNVNNPPKLQGIRDRTVLEDHWLNFTVSARDEDLEIGVPDVISFSTNVSDGVGDDDLPNFSYVTDPEDPTRIRVSFLPMNVDVGVILVEFRVRDGFAAVGEWQDTRTMVITVVNTNDAPVLTEVSGVSLEGVVEYPMVAIEDIELRLTILADDDDSDQLFYYVDDSRFDLEQPGGGYEARLAFTPGNDDVGSIYVTLSVWDIFNTFDQLVLNITVVNVNDPPHLVQFEAKDTIGVEELEFTLFEDVLFTAPILVTDIDSDKLTFSDNQGIFTFFVDPADPYRALANFTPDQSNVGQIITILEVDDGDGDVDVINLIINVVATNDRPSTIEITQMDLNSLTIPMRSTLATDSDGDDLTYTWDYGDHGPTDSGVDLIEVTHTYYRPGTYIVTVTVDDGNGGTSVSQEEILVPDLGEDPQETEVQEGPVLLVGVLIGIFAGVALVFLYLYWRMPTRKQE